MSAMVQATVKVGQHKIDHHHFSSPILTGNVPILLTGIPWIKLDEVFVDDKNLHEFLTSTRAGTGLLNNVIADVKFNTRDEVILNIDQAMILLKDQRRHQMDVQKSGRLYLSEVEWEDLKGLPTAAQWTMTEASRFLDKLVGPSTGNTTVHRPSGSVTIKPDGQQLK